MTNRLRITISAACAALLYSAAGLVWGNTPRLTALLGAQILHYAFTGLLVLVVGAAGAAILALIRVLLQLRALPPTPVPIKEARAAVSLAWIGLFCGLSLMWLVLNVIGTATISEVTPKTLLGRYAHLGLYSLLALSGAAGGIVATPVILALFRRYAHPQAQALMARGLSIPAGAVCGLLLTAAFWNAVGAVVLSKATEEVRQAGYPVTPLVTGPKLADMDNGAFFYEKINAVASLADVRERGTEQLFLKIFLDQVSRGTAVASDYERARQIVARHADGLQLWELAAARLHTNWDIDLGYDPAKGTPHSQYFGIAVMSKVLATRAVIQARDGQSREAVESVRLVLIAAQSLEHQGLLIAVLVQSMLGNTALETGRVVLRQAPPDLAQERWAPLLDADSLKKTFRTALGYRHFAESLAAAQITWWDITFGKYRGLTVDKNVFGMQLPPAGPRRATHLTFLTFYWPFMKLDIASGLRGRLEIDRALENPIFLRHVDYDKVVEQAVFREWMLAAINMGNYWPAHEKILETAANLRLARAALAARLFKEKQGRWPRSPDELTEFSKEKFEDPFSAGPLKLTKGKDGPVLYSVGPDLTDNGGAAYDEDKMTGDLSWGL